jgi:transposase
MRNLVLMEVSSLLSLPEGLCVEWIKPQAADLLVGVVSVRLSSCCPLCAQASSQVHSQYQRTLRDVPCGGRKVVLRLAVRKFFCRNPDCARKIFTERLPPFVEPWAQVTARLFEAVQAIGLATSGELGTRLADRIRIHASPTTMLRRIMDLSSPAAGRVTVLGIDDFSFKRGRRFGTILVDLSNHQVIDLLEERSTKSAADWMRHHPEIEYVSRDRGNEYAQAAREGASQATPVADRFHLVKNLVEAIEPVVARCYREMRKVQEPLPEPRVPKVKEWRPARSPAHEHQYQSRLAEKQERFDSMIALQKLGIPQDEVARRLGVTVRTVQNWNKQGSCPGSRRRRKRRSLFDPYAAYVLNRWKEGCKKGSVLYREIKEKGYRGTERQVYHFLKTLKQEPVELPALSVVNRISVQEALWLIARPFDHLNEDERADLQELCQASSRLSTLHTLVQSFGQIARKREGHRLEDWKKHVAESGLPEVQRFAKGLERDKEAVLAGLTVVHSNAQVEGQVNKLKMLKRTMYGRAGFPLLRQRVLHAL